MRGRRRPFEVAIGFADSICNEDMISLITEREESIEPWDYARAGFF